jgi:hypothetical protein
LRGTYDLHKDRPDHLNIRAGDIRARRDFCVDTLGHRLYERIELDDGSEAGAWIENNVYIEFVPSKHNIAQGFFLYGYKRCGKPIEITSGGRLGDAPFDPCVVWTEARCSDPLPASGRRRRSGHCRSLLAAFL